MVNIYTYLNIFLDDPNKQVFLADFEKYYKLPHQTIKRHLKEAPFLEQVKHNKFKIYKILQSHFLKDYLSIAQKERTFNFFEKPIFKLLLNYIPKNQKVLLFGSCTHSKNFKDIDILHIGEKKIDFSEFETIYSQKVHYIRTQKITEKLRIELIKNHIIVNNHDYFVQFLYDKLV